MNNPCVASRVVDRTKKRHTSLASARLARLRASRRARIARMGRTPQPACERSGPSAPFRRNHPFSPVNPILGPARARGERPSETPDQGVVSARYTAADDSSRTRGVPESGREPFAFWIMPTKTTSFVGSIQNQVPKAPPQ
jgi:hypothetical protein